MNNFYDLNKQKTVHHSNCPKDTILYCKNSFVVNQILVFQIKLCYNHHLRQS